MKHSSKVASEDYVRKVRSRVVKKSQKAIDDLLFVAAELPERNLRKIFTQERMASLISVLLTTDLEVITTQRLPPSMGRERPKNSKTYKQLAGVWRDKSGGFLKRPDLRRRIMLGHSISRATHESLSQLSRFKHLKKVVWLTKEERRTKIGVSNFSIHTKKRQRHNLATGKVEEIDEHFIALRVHANKSNRVNDISVIVVEGKQASTL